MIYDFEMGSPSDVELEQHARYTYQKKCLYVRVTTLPSFSPRVHALLGDPEAWRRGLQ